MVYKIYLQPIDGTYPIIIASKLTVLPNKFDGLQELQVKNIDTFWTGISHIYVRGNISFQLTEFDIIKERSTLDETDEDWKQIAKHPKGPFNYEVYRQLGKFLDMHINNKHFWDCKCEGCV